MTTFDHNFSETSSEILQVGAQNSESVFTISGEPWNESEGWASVIARPPTASQYQRRAFVVRTMQYGGEISMLSVVPVDAPGRPLSSQSVVVHTPDTTAVIFGRPYYAWGSVAEMNKVGKAWKKTFTQMLGEFRQDQILLTRTCQPPLEDSGTALFFRTPTYNDGLMVERYTDVIVNRYEDGPCGVDIILKHCPITMYKMLATTVNTGLRRAILHASPRAYRDSPNSYAYEAAVFDLLRNAGDLSRFVSPREVVRMYC